MGDATMGAMYTYTHTHGYHLSVVGCCSGAGPKRLYVSYYRKRVYADLLPDGSIRYKNEVYTSPVPCALHMKRTLNPCTWCSLAE